MYVAKNQKDWDDFIPLILFAHRTSISEAIGDSPFYCLYGREPRFPVDVKFLPPAADDLSTSVLDHRKRIVEKVELAQNLARENIQRSQQKMKEYYDRNASQPLFEIGQRVWVRVRVRVKRRRAYQGNSFIIGLVRTESSNNRLLFIIGCVLKTTRRLLSLFMLIE